ncbi:hypothetical protein FO519_004758 [Halicephalobus sp. NKZ332]|nr:hypothetical protein FO519_004758 [Halicephalobus sp. NKZ332]
MKQGNGRQFAPPNLPPGPGTSGWQPQNMNQPHGVQNIQRQRNIPPQQIPGQPSAIPIITHGSTRSGRSSHSKTGNRRSKNLVLEKDHKTQSWHDFPRERKVLKKNHLGAPDVFPQEPQQEEDNMSQERIKKGFIPQVFPCETESAISRFLNDPDSADEVLTRVASFLQQIVPAKNETSLASMERKKLNSINFQQMTKQGEATLSPKVLQWIADLNRGKPYHSLTKRIPMMMRVEEGLELAFDHKIPVPHALWFLLTHYVGQIFLNKQNVGKKTVDICDYTMMFMKVLKDTLEKVEEDSPIAKQKWKYFTFLIRSAVMNGMVERQEFLIEVCDYLIELHHKPSEKMQTFRMMLSFASMFTRDIVQNVFISRKFLHLVTMRLKAYVDEAEKKKKTKLNAYTVLQDLISCVHHRSIIMTCFGLATAIICDCPTAAVWTPLEETNVPIHLVGTSLEHFPIDPAHISLFFKYSKEYSKNFRFTISTRLEEIRRRSHNVDQRWALNSGNCIGFQNVMKACIDVISLLDTADIYNPRSLLSLYAKVYGFTKDVDSFEDEAAIRTKAMFHWAVSHEREGSHRATLITKLIKLHIKHFNAPFFDGKTVVQVMVDFLNKEGPRPEKKGFKQEFANLMLLLIELQKVKLFSHDEYVTLLMRYDIVNMGEGILTRTKRLLDVKEPETRNTTKVEESASELGDSLIVSFIPTPAELRSGKQEKQNPQKAEFCTLKDEEDNDRPFMEKPAELTIHERILIHLPIDQVEGNRGTINQRATLLYGITEERELAKMNAKKFAQEVLKLWNRHSVKFYNSAKVVRRKHYQEVLNKMLQEFRSFTYYDQLVISGICSDGYCQLISGFPRTTNIQPNMECLDMLVAMFEQCQAIGECMEYISEILPLILRCEDAMDEFRTDCIPGSFSSQQSFVMVGFLVDHYKYFLLHRKAVVISNGLYRLIEKEVKLKGYPASCFARTVAAFLTQARYDLRFYGRATSLAFSANVCKSLLPEPGMEGDFTDATYNPELFKEMLNQPKRCISYHDYKIRLPSIDSNSSKYSFVINAFRTAREFKNDYEKIAELTNICGHVSVQKNLATEWLTVIEALCSPLSGKRNLPGFKQLEPVEDLKTHFFYSTFITLLASRFCFSSHALFVRLNSQAIVPYLKSPKTIQMVTENKAHLLLTLQIVANIVTSSDEPFQLSKDFYYSDQERSYVLQRPSDLRCLRILHIRELDAMILPLLTNIFFISDMIKKDDNLKEIYKFLFNTVLTISDQEWVIERMFQICQSDRDIEEFNTGVFGKDSLGQYLLRIALRRKSERETKMELVNSKGSKKALIDKLFSVLTIWNLRASYCDLKVMIKDTTPGKGAKYHQQNTIVADALMKEISRSCRDFFFSAEKLNEVKAPQTSLFEFSDMNAYWLISELLDIVTPENVTKTIKALFLEEMLNLISTSQMGLDEGDKIKRLKQSASLLGEQPFVNIILTCQNSEDKGRENLKFRREFGEKQISTKLFGLQQLLPIKQTQAEIQSFNDAYSLNSPVKGSGSKVGNGTVAGFARNVKHIRIDKQAEPSQKKILRMIYHNHQNEFFHPGTPGKGISRNHLENFVIGPPDYPEVQKLPQDNAMRQNMQTQGQGNMPQGVLNSGPPSAGNFPGGPPSVGAYASGSMIPANAMQPPGGFPGPQGTQFNSMGVHPGPPNPGFMAQRMPIQQETMMRPPIPNAPGPVRGGMRKRGSSSAIATPVGPRAPKRPKREMEQGQVQPPGGNIQNPPSYFAHQQKQGAQWHPGLPQQGYNMGQVPGRFPPPVQPAGNVPGGPLNPQMMQRPENYEAKETKEILKATIQKKNKDKQGSQVPQGQMRHPMIQGMPMGPGGPQMNMGQGQRMPMNPNMPNPNQFPPGHMPQNNF